MKRVLGRPDSTTLLFSALAGAPATVDGSVLVEEGVLHSEALTLRGRDAVALTKGSVDLPAWQLDSTTEIHRDADPQKAYLTVRLRGPLDEPNVAIDGQRSEEHTSELQSLMRISYAVFCLKKKRT